MTLASLISVLAGLMIFPVLASTGIDPTAGPGLTFMTMPAVFNHLPFSQGLAVVFFLLLLVAALLLHLHAGAPGALHHREWGWSRRGACRVLTLLIMASGIPVSLSFGPWSELTLFGKTIFDLLDYLTSNLMMPLFGLVLTLLLGWRLGESVLPAGLSPLLRGSLLWCWRLVAPLLIAGILVRGLL